MFIVVVILRPSPSRFKIRKQNKVPQISFHATAPNKEKTYINNNQPSTGVP